MAIYLKVPKNTVFEDIKALIIFGYTYNGTHFVATYKESECITLECKPANRSFEDLLEICQTYFPNSTDVDLANTLYELNQTPLNLTYVYCADIHKSVYYLESSPFPFSDETFLTELRGNSPYSLQDVLNLVTVNKK
jgi:hypothetical protein